MSGRFKGLKDNSSPAVNSGLSMPDLEAASPAGGPGRNPREGKKAVVGYFSPAVNKALRQLALDNDTTTQALIGEAIDDLMRKYGRHPFGER